MTQRVGGCGQVLPDANKAKAYAKQTKPKWKPSARRAARQQRDALDLYGAGLR